MCPELVGVNTFDRLVGPKLFYQHLLLVFQFLDCLRVDPRLFGNVCVVCLFCCRSLCLSGWDKLVRIFGFGVVPDIVVNVAIVPLGNEFVCCNALCHRTLLLISSCAF